MDRQRPRRTSIQVADFPGAPDWIREQTARIAFLGAGRAATTLAGALHRGGYRIVAVSSNSPASAESLAARLPDALAVDASELPALADVVFLTVPDPEIASACALIPWKPGMGVLHCAGSLDLSPLASANEAGAFVGAMHPLQALTGSDVSLMNVTFAIEAEEPFAGWIHSVARSLGGHPVDLTPGSRTAYHLGAVMVSNFSVALTELASRIWRDAGFTREEAVSALAALLTGTASNLATDGLPGALTGPIARGDAATIDRHLDYLGDRHPDLTSVYRTLSLAALDLAKERGLNPGLAAELHGRLAKGETDGSIHCS